MNPKNQTNLLRFSIAVMAVMLFGSISVQAASQTWTNAPVDATWTNVNNWVAKAVPGALNQTGNSVNNDVATFNSPIFGTIGGAADPIVPDDATILNDRSRTVGSIIFDTINCGAYVFNSTSLPNLPTALNPETGILNVCHNGSITINAAVTNSQVFLLPVEIRLPSSTAGVYHFVNNATDPSVTLFLNSVTNQSASTRGTVFTLDGSNTGTNTIESLSKGSTTSGGMGLNKVGSGRWILPNASDLAGQTVETINAGTLEVGNAGSLGSPTAATINSNGVLQVDGVTLSQTSFNLQGNGTFRMNGSATVNSVTVGNVTGSTFPKLTTTSSSDVLTVGTAANAVTGGASDSILHIGGPGTVYLGQTANYIGNWSVDAGTLQVAVVGALGSGPLINVGAGGTLDLTPFGATSWVPDTGSFGGSGTGTTVGSTAATVTAAVGGTINLNGKGITLTYTPTSFSGDTAHPALYVSQGTLSLGGNDFVINNASGTPLGIGTYVVMQQASGSISSAGSYSAIVQGSGTVPNTIGLIQVSGGNVNLVISAYTAKNLIWQGGNPNNNWDNGTTANWLDGALSSVFTVSDYVAFDATGATNPVVNLVGTLSPSGLSVDTSATNYTFTGGGRVAGATGLTKIGTGTLSLQTTNTYIGNTAISNGTIQIAANNALSSATAVSISGPGTLDLNGFSDSVASLSGSGTVDNNGAAASTLTLGNDNGSGSFSGVIQSSSNTVTVVKGGSGTQVLTGSSTYAGATTIANGTLRIGNASALGSNTNVLTITGGILDLASDLNIGSLTGSGSTIANNSSATLNTLTINSPVATTYSGNIVDGTGGGAVSVKLLNGASLTFAGNSTFSGGTYVGSGSTFNIPNGPASVGGSLIASNGAVLFLSGGSSTPGTPTNVLTVDGATVTITNGAEGKIWNCQWVGGPTSTNVFDSVGSAGQSMSFANFLGLVQLTAPNSGNFRFFNGGGDSGGDNTTFEFDGSNMHTRDAQNVHLGAIAGGTPASGIGGPSTAGAVDTYYIGAKGVDMNFGGYIAGSNNIVKVGAGTLTLNGGFTTNIVDTTGLGNYVTNVYAANLISYLGNTTISNGTLKVNVPDLLTNSPNVTLASASAVLDASSMGWISNQTDNATYTNQVLITNSTFEVLSGKTFGGIGMLNGFLLADAGSTLNVGLPVGTLTVSSNAEIAGTVNMSLDRDTTPNASELAAQAFTIDGTASLTVTNVGSTLHNGDTFQLFSQPVSFASVSLPTISNGYLTNNLNVDGTISVVSFVNPNPTNITTSVSAGVLTLSWPSDHTGWMLQVQTNSLATGLGTNWVNVTGSDSTNSVAIPLDTTAGTIFYRMVY